MTILEPSYSIVVWDFNGISEDSVVDRKFCKEAYDTSDFCTAGLLESTITSVRTILLRIKIIIEEIIPMKFLLQYYIETRKL